MYKGSTMQLDSYAKDIDQLIQSATSGVRNEMNKIRTDLCEESEEEKEVKKFTKNYIIR